MLSLFYGQNGSCGSKEPSHISFCFSHALKMFVGVYNLDGKIQCSLYFLEQTYGGSQSWTLLLQNPLFILSMVGRYLTHLHGKLGPEMEKGTVKIAVRTDSMWHALLLSQRQANPCEFTQDKGITSCSEPNQGTKALEATHPSILLLLH